MRMLPNLIRNINQKIDVWRKHAPNYIQELENKLSLLGHKGKRGQNVLSAGNLSKQEYEQQAEVIEYFEKEIGSWSEFESGVIDAMEEQGYDVTLQSQIDDWANMLGNYNQLVTKLFELFPSGEASAYLQGVEQTFGRGKNSNVEAKIEALQDYISSGGNPTVNYATVNEYYDNMFTF